MRGEHFGHRHDGGDAGVNAAGFHLAVVVGVDRDDVDRVADLIERGGIDEA